MIHRHVSTPTGHTVDPAPARLGVGIISAGRVGTALGVALERAGHVVAAVSARSAQSRQQARTRLPHADICPVDVVATRSELLTLAVPDPQLAVLVDELTTVIRPGTIVVHTSGAQGVTVLAPLRERGATCLAIHPAMTFTGNDEDIARIGECCFGITADDETGYTVAESLVIEVGGEPVRVPEAARPLYHAALAHGSNHLVTLVVDAVSALRAVPGLSGEDDEATAERVLRPLLSAALDNALRRGSGALTGPVARGDTRAVAGHLRALEAVDSGLARGYRAFSLRTAEQVCSNRAMVEMLFSTTEGDLP